MSFGCAGDTTPSDKAARAADPLPDLVVNADAITNQYDVVTRDFAAESCAVVEGCVPESGMRRLLLFDVEVRNLGPVDFVIGSPQGDERFEHSACHDHFHFTGFTRYELLAPGSEEPVAVARKQGFCLRDSAPFASDAPGKYHCENQGISVGWADIYDRGIDCQWLDVTGLPPGDYTLRIVVNPENAFEESVTTNNVVTVPVVLPAEPALQ